MKEERKNIMEKLLCPSMMCANFGNLENEIRKYLTDTSLSGAAGGFCLWQSNAE